MSYHRLSNPAPTSRQQKSTNPKVAPEKYAPIPKHEVESLLEWAAEVLSAADRPKIKTMRGFSDGVMMAKLLHHYRPDIIDTHHFWSCSSRTKKRENWNHLNLRVFPKLGFTLTPEEIDDLASFTANSIETLLIRVKQILDPNVDSPLIRVPEENGPSQGTRTHSPPGQARELLARVSALQRQLVGQPAPIGIRASTIDKPDKAKQWRFKNSDQAMYNDMEKLQTKIQGMKTKMSSSYEFFLGKLKDKHEKVYGTPFPTRLGGLHGKIPDKHLEAFKGILEREKEKEKKAEGNQKK